MTQREHLTITKELSIKELNALPYDDVVYYMRNNIFIFINSLSVVKWTKFDVKYKITKEKPKT